MATYILHANIPEDRRLVVELPPDAPTGEAEVTVTVADGEGEGGERRGRGPEYWAELFEQWKQEGWHGTGRTKEEIDAEIRAMRDEWDD